jgi:hypothetical protein
MVRTSPTASPFSLVTTFKSEFIKHFIFCYLFWSIDRLKTVPPLKGPKPALDFEKAGLEGLPRPGNTGYYSWTDPRMRNPRNYSTPKEKYQGGGAHAQKHSPLVTNKVEPGKVLTRATCAKIHCSFSSIISQPASVQFSCFPFPIPASDSW